MRSLNLAKVAEKKLSSKKSSTKATSAKSIKTSAASTPSSGTRAVSDLSYKMAAHYLTHTEGMPAVGTKFLPTPDRNGSKTKSRLKRLGVLGKHKGLLMTSSNIDDEIAKATGALKSTLEEIKKRGLA